jgi:hypothetical protein
MINFTFLKIIVSRNSSIMYTGFKHLHSFTADFTLFFLILSIIYAVYQLLNKGVFTKSGKIIFLLALIGTHFQFVVGIALYFISPLGFSNFSANTMKNSVGRLYILEHPMMMILGIVFITIGYSRAKRKEVALAKYKNIAIFYSLGLILILSRIPWKAWIG